MKASGPRVPHCQLCNREVNFSSVAYIRGSVMVCRSCFPGFYVRQLCGVAKRRLRGENPLACSFCRFRDECDSYISRTVRSLS